MFQTFNGLKYKIDFQNSKYHDDFSILLRIYPGGVIEATGKTLPAPPAERTSIRRKFRTSDSYLHIRLYACPFLVKTRRYRSRRYIAAVFSRIQNSFSRWDSVCACMTDTTRVSARTYVYKIQHIERSPSCLQNLSLLSSAIPPFLTDSVLSSSLPLFSSCVISLYICKNPFSWHCVCNGTTPDEKILKSFSLRSYSGIMAHNRYRV